MNPDTLFIIKVFFGIIAAVFTLSTAVFTFLDSAQNEDNKPAQAWFQRKWEAIGQSRWLTLPETATRWLLNIRIILAEFIRKQKDSEKGEAGYKVNQFLLASIPILLSIACLIYWGTLAAFLSLIIGLPLLFFAVFDKIFDKISKILAKISVFVNAIYVLIALFVPELLTVFLWLQIILNLNLYYAAFIMILFIPFFWVAVLLPIGSGIGGAVLNFDYNKENAFAVFLVGVAGGFTVTLLALMIGHIIDPVAYVPQTLQMLISNVMFDGLTMAVTFAILDKALAKDGMFRLPAAILLDILVGAVFAFCSLYFGLVFTEKAVSLQDNLHILFGRSYDNTHFELSPYFWVMHTTFIPTLLYLAMILFCWAGKLLLIPVRAFCGLGQTNKNPLKLTAGLCGIFAAIFTVLYFATNAAYDRAKDLKSGQPPKIGQPAAANN